jgi:hypothetical protein
VRRRVGNIWFLENINRTEKGGEVEQRRLKLPEPVIKGDVIPIL